MHNTNQTNHDNDTVMIPMVTTIEAALDFGYSLSDIRPWKIGNRICTVVLVPGSKELCKAYLNSFYNEFKAEERDKRCSISNSKGRTIRCPESNKCSECPYHSSFDKMSFGTFSFSDLSTNYDEGSDSFDPESPEDYYSADHYLNILYDLMGYVAKERPEFSEIVHLLSDGYSRREIAKLLDMPKSTIIDWVKKIQALAIEFLDTVL